MSRHAIDWVWKQDIKPATLKLLMLSIADRADEDNCAFPSIARLVKDTGLNNKTAQAGVNKLIEQGYVVDTGKRRGPTMRVRVLKILMLSVSEMEAQPSILNTPKNGHISQDTPPQSPDCKASNDPKNGNVPKNGNIPDNGVLNDPNNGVLNDPNNGVQNHPLEPPIEPLKKINKKSAMCLDVLPSYIDLELMTDYIAMRISIKAPMTQRALTILINEIGRLRAQGHDPTVLLESAILNNWKSVYPPRGAFTNGHATNQPVNNSAPARVRAANAANQARRERTEREIN
jgi:hypothetical protein